MWKSSGLIVTIAVSITLFLPSGIFPVYVDNITGGLKSRLGIGRDKPIVKVMSFYNFKVLAAEGGEIFDFSSLKGKVVVVSNVASKCGLTNSMYSLLGMLAQKYGPSGKFVIVGFPCAQFLNQEFEKPEQTCPFVRGLLAKFGDIQEKKYFNLMEKVNVNGPETHEVFQFLKYNSELYDESSDSVSPFKWNFGKFLVDKEGRVIKYYSPTDGDMESDVQAALDDKLQGKPIHKPNA